MGGINQLDRYCYSEKSDFLLRLSIYVCIIRVIYQGFIQALLSTAVFPQTFSFFTVWLVNYLREVLLWLIQTENFLSSSPDCWKFYF